MTVRKASHAGSWYSDDGEELSAELANWLKKVPVSTEEGVPIPVLSSNAVISPHAGYSYSGPTAAYAFKCIDTSRFKRVFILGPSHHVYLKGCAVTSCEEYCTPLGNLKIDQKINAELLATGDFSEMSISVDEDEHSIEMQLPYLFKIFESRISEVTFIPVLVGSLSTSGEKKYGKLFEPYLRDKETLFVISSDFCHWGSRFQYTFYSTAPTPSQHPSDYHSTNNHTIPLHVAIENLDREGMHRISECKHAPFREYLDVTENTICGRHPIGILLATIELIYPIAARNVNSDSSPSIKFTHYAQSSRIDSPRDSSVSYASAYLHNPVA